MRRRWGKRKVQRGCRATFLAAPGDEAAAVELTYYRGPEPYTGGRNFGHLAYAVDNIYDTCNAFIAHGMHDQPPAA